jgi:hypothetical protein
MLLKEFFNFDTRTDSYKNDKRYDAGRDSSVLEKKDTRKVRLTLRQINQLRMQSEAHEMEKESELGFVRQMYGQPAAEPAA